MTEGSLRKCPSCGEEKAPSLFWRHAGHRLDATDSACAACQAEAQRARRARRKAEVIDPRIASLESAKKEQEAEHNKLGRKLSDLKVQAVLLAAEWRALGHPAIGAAKEAMDRCNEQINEAERSFVSSAFRLTELSIARTAEGSKVRAERMEKAEASLREAQLQKQGKV